MLQQILGTPFSNLGYYMITWYIVIGVSLSGLAVAIHKQETRQNKQ
jgi:hypothetical protein